MIDGNKKSGEHPLRHLHEALDELGISWEQASRMFDEIEKGGVWEQEKLENFSIPRLQNMPRYSVTPSDALNCRKEQTLPEKLLDLMKNHVENASEGEYINPNFLLSITSALEEYYSLEDEYVDKWVENMWSM